MSADPAEVVIRVRLEYPPGAPQMVPVPADDEALLYRKQDAARMLAIGESLLTELIARGEIKSVKIGTVRRISRAAIEAYIARQEGGADERAG